MLKKNQKQTKPETSTNTQNSWSKQKQALLYALQSLAWSLSEQLNCYSYNSQKWQFSTTLQNRHYALIFPLWQQVMQFIYSALKYFLHVFQKYSRLSIFKCCEIRIAQESCTLPNPFIILSNLNSSASYIFQDKYSSSLQFFFIQEFLRENQNSCNILLTGK